MLNGVLFNIIFYGFLVGFFDISVSCFDDCHNSVMGVVVAVVSKNYLLNDHTRTNIFNFHNNHNIILQGVRGIKGVGSLSSNRISL